MIPNLVCWLHVCIEQYIFLYSSLSFLCLQVNNNYYYWLSMGPNDCHCLCRTRKLCRGRAGLEYFCRQPQQTLIFSSDGYYSLYNTCWLGMSYEASHHSIPPFHSTECRHPMRTPSNLCFRSKLLGVKSLHDS